jgi:hypothetical protein
MAVIDIARGQTVEIPAIQLTNGTPFLGSVKASDGETMIIELITDSSNAVIPADVEEVVMLNWEIDGLKRSCPLLIRSRTPRALVGQVVIRERRDAPRLRVDVQLAYEVIRSDQVKDVADEVMARMNAHGEPESESAKLMRASDEDEFTALHDEIADLRKMLTELIMKVDDLTALAVGSTPASTASVRTPLVIQNCSSTGMGFLAAEPVQVGEYMRMMITLRTAPQTNIECMGVVMRCRSLEEEPGGEHIARFDIGTHFTHIHEADRERLIHYLFKVQRRLLRDLKEKRLAMNEKQERISPVL